MSRKYLFAGCLTILLYAAAGEYGCPPPEDIEPCTCTEDVVTNLKCQEVYAVDKLVSVFTNAQRYHFNEFILKNSSLQYIPHEVFQNVEVKTITFKDVSFVHTFDVVPNNPGVKEMHIANVRVMGGWKWENLRVFTHLEALSISDVPMKRLSTTFQPNIPKSLKKLWLNWCQMKTFRDTEFAAFRNLRVFTATNDVITAIKRSMFANPSRLEEISFDYNRLSSIPENMFTNMPDLEHVSLANNQLAVLPEKAFKPVYDHLVYLRVHDNKLKCDCLIQWLVFHKPKFVTGTCKTPKALHGKKLQQLTYQDFRC